jgi:acyl carrier protein
MNTTSPELRAQIVQLLSDVSAVPVADIKDTDHLTADLGMDSVAFMELLGMLDEEFGIEVELQAVQGIELVGTVIELVRERVHVE